MLDSDWPQSDMFIVYYKGGDVLEAENVSHSARKLEDRLFLVSTSETQSKLYHHVKRLAQPDALFVGRLAALPKFKGMKAGTTKWVGSLMSA